MVYTNVGWVSQFYDTHYVWFSQTDLQKGLILPQKTLIFLHWAKVSTFQKIKLNWSSQWWFSKIGCYFIFQFKNF
jgi:hypothetical protein